MLYSLGCKNIIIIDREEPLSGSIILEFVKSDCLEFRDTM